MTDVVLRPATVDDAHAVAVLQTTCWEQTYRGHVHDAYLDATGVAQRLPRWRDRIARGLTVVLAERRGELVGVASAGPSRDDPPVRDLELMTLYTLAALHGSGLGAALLDATIGLRRASLWVFEANARAIAFYTRHGFVADGITADDVDTGVRELRMVR